MRDRSRWAYAACFVAVVLASGIAAVLQVQEPALPTAGNDSGASAPLGLDTTSVDDDHTVGAADTITPVAPLSREAQRAIPLPPVDMPLRDSLPLLQDAARRGNAVAACRLSMETERCARTRRLARTASASAEIAQLAQGEEPQADIDRRIERIAARQDVIEEALAGCEGVDVSLDTIVRHRLQAAAAGHPTMQVRYLYAEHLYGPVLLRDPTLLDEYRRNAHRYFQQAMASGELELLPLWHFAASDPEAIALTPFLPERWRDPGLVAALVEQLTPEQRQMFDFRGSGAPLATPTAAQRDEAARLYAQYFAGARRAATTPASLSTSESAVDSLRSSLLGEIRDCAMHD